MVLARLMIVAALVLSPATLAGKTRIEFVYFVGAGCALCKDQDLRTSLAAALTAIEGESERRGWSFSAIAVAVDEDPEVGTAFLRTYCPEFDTHVCTGDGYETRLFQELVMKAPARQEGVNVQVEGVPYVVLSRIDGKRTVLARYLGSTILPFLKWITVADPAEREEAFGCAFDQKCSEGPSAKVVR